MSSSPATAVFGGGCFWCVEAVFQRLVGVSEVVSGYAGGHVPNPTYRQICEKNTGHAEVCRITFDPAQISFEDLVDVFFHTHDPTTPNRQGNDVGPQYRSIILYQDEEQKRTAEAVRARLDASGEFGAPIVTEIVPAATFYPGEDYHQNYFNDNPGQGYCMFVVKPKVDKFRKLYRDRAKPGA